MRNSAPRSATSRSRRCNGANEILVPRSKHDPQAGASTKRPTPVHKPRDDTVRSHRNRHRTTATRLAQTGTGGADRDRTGDPLLAKQVLSQLSYSPGSGRTREAM